MPHAENRTNGTMGEPLTNGEKPHFKVISHVTSYPVVSDTISAVKGNPYGQKSIDLANTAYSTFAAPVLPYLQGPLSVLSPYVERADSLADSGLSKVETKFPIVKEDTQKIKGSVLDKAYFPLRLAGQGRDYIFSTWQDEYSKTGGEGIVKLAKAAISTELKFGLDAYHTVAAYLSKGKETAQTKVNEKTNN